MLTGEQWLQIAGVIGGIVFGGGGIAALYGVYVTRKLGIKTGENEANRDLNSTWDAIVENLQGQINTQSANFTEQVKELHQEVNSLKTRLSEQENALGIKERLLLRAILHIGRLELLVPPKPVPPRPEGLE
jgi:predicted nuclease with TOPRIM domain